MAIHAVKVEDFHSKDYRSETVMGRFFDLESPIMRTLNRVADLMILNLLMIVCCIPVITVGASVTAMHYVILKMVRGEEGYLVKGFFKSFAANFKQATLIWLLMMVVIAVYVGDALIFSFSGMVFPMPNRCFISRMAWIKAFAASSWGVSFWAVCASMARSCSFR